jgi:spore coat protein H
MINSSPALVRQVCSSCPVLLLVLSACSSHQDNSQLGAAGAGASGGSDSAAALQAVNYAEAFPQDRVRRMDITISAENWQKMLADMTDMLGAFGSSGHGTATGNQQMGGGGAGPSGTFTPNQATDPMGQAGASSGTPPFGAQSTMLWGQAGSGGPSPWGAAGSAAMTPPQSGGLPIGQAGAGSTAPIGTPGDGATQPGGGQSMGEGSVDMVPRTPIYVECDIASEGATLHHVGIRFKGNSSLATSWQQGIYKLPLRLKFDKFEESYPDTKNQRYYGFADLSLSNGQSDPSLLRDKIGTEVFVRAGLPAPASAFFRVYIDHGDGPTYFGLYTGIELPSEKAFLQRYFANDTGNLYKPDGVGARLQTYDEATLSKESNVEAADYSDVRGLYDALHADRTDAAVWRSGLEARFDAKVFLHWLALNTVVQDWDSYGQMAHNYYLYGDPSEAGRLIWIPWDHSYAFTGEQRTLDLSLSEVTDTWPLIRYLLDDASYAGVYRNYVAQAAAEEYDPTWATERFQSAHDLIAPYVTGDNGEQSGYSFISSKETFDSALVSLKNHVTQRQSDVAAFLAQ